MNDDLISRKAVIENIWSLFNNTYNNSLRFETEETKLAKSILSDVQTEIENQPTIYDVDNVVKKLKENEEDVIKAIKENSISEFQMIKIMDLQKLFEEYTKEQIEIVKSGGIEGGENQ